MQAEPGATNLRHLPLDSWRPQIFRDSELRVHVGAVALSPEMYTSGSWTGARRSRRYRLTVGELILWQVNYLGPYLLTRLLEPALAAAAPAARVVNLSSVMSRLGSMPPNPRDYLVSEAAGLPPPPLHSRMHSLAVAVYARSAVRGPVQLRLKRGFVTLVRLRLLAAA